MPMPTKRSRGGHPFCALGSSSARRLIILLASKRVVYARQSPLRLNAPLLPRKGRVLRSTTPARVPANPRGRLVMHDRRGKRWILFSLGLARFVLLQQAVKMEGTRNLRYPYLRWSPPSPARPDPRAPRARCSARMVLGRAAAALGVTARSSSACGRACAGASSAALRPLSWLRAAAPTGEAAIPTAAPALTSAHTSTPKTTGTSTYGRLGIRTRAGRRSMGTRSRRVSDPHHVDLSHAAPDFDASCTRLCRSIFSLMGDVNLVSSAHLHVRPMCPLSTCR